MTNNKILLFYNKSQFKKIKVWLISTKSMNLKMIAQHSSLVKNCPNNQNLHFYLILRINYHQRQLASQEEHYQKLT